MNSAPVSQPDIVNVASTPAPAPAPAPTPAPAPVVAAPSVAMADGGSTTQSVGESGWRGFWSSLNIIEVALLIGGVAALASTIYYFRFKLQQDKMINNELQRQIDELKMNMQSALKGKYKNL